MANAEVLEGILTPDQLKRTVKTPFLINALRTQILDGDLLPGTPLPSTSTAARILHMERKSIGRAYGELAEQGLLHRIQGRGYVVGQISPELARAGHMLSGIIVNDLEAQFAAGELKAGMQVPSVQDMTEMYDASSSSVNRALKNLRDKGSITTTQGNRNVVSEKVVPVTEQDQRFLVPIDEGSSLWERDVRRRGYKYQTIKDHVVEPDEDEAALMAYRLQLPSTAEIVSLTDSRYITSEQRPRVLFDQTTFYMDRRTAMLIGALSKDEKNGKQKRLKAWTPDESELRKVREISAEQPTREERIIYRIPEGVALLKKQTVLFANHRDRPIYTRVQVFPANRGVFRGTQ